MVVVEVEALNAASQHSEQETLHMVEIIGRKLDGPKR
jgi:hypothetical protein